MLAPVLCTTPSLPTDPPNSVYNHTPLIIISYPSIYPSRISLSSLSLSNFLSLSLSLSCFLTHTNPQRPSLLREVENLRLERQMAPPAHAEMKDVGASRAVKLLSIKDEHAELVREKGRLEGQNEAAK